MVKMMKQTALWICVLCLCMSILSPMALATEPPIARIPMSLTLDGPNPEEPEIFLFELAAQDAGAPLPQGAVDGVYIHKVLGQAALVIPISCPNRGVFHYTFRQLAGENENCTYDEQVYHITIYVTNGDNDELRTNVAVYKDGVTDEKSEIAFRNVYAESAEISIAALKTMDGETPEDGAFTFRLTDESGAVIAQVQNVGKDVLFPAMSYDRVGTYKYEISEVPGTDATIVYDPIVYQAIVEVTRDEERNYQATLTYEKDGKVLEELPLFRNETVQDIPQTGDNGQILLYMELMLVSGLAIVALLLSKKRLTKA